MSINETADSVDCVEWSINSIFLGTYSTNTFAVWHLCHGCHFVTNELKSNATKNRTMRSQAEMNKMLTVKTSRSRVTCG